ncbi:P22-like antirepressor protein [Nicoletella semolina]|uniref:P22-like antirepressor protein n=1 Tax=Nicoletella semolina TaxID=271160 RepID=A0A4R2NAH3_9PAST|nr:P22-like antirepressor protein [Nicoletella semolina]
MMSLLGWVAKGLEVIGSKFAGEAYGCSTEYRRQSDKTKPTLELMIAKIEHKGTRQELTHRLTASV